MSWQAYVDTSLLGSGQLDQAAIVSKAGDSVWASSPGFPVKPDELKALVRLYSDPSQAFASGFHVASTKYMTISADEKTIVGKKGKSGIVCVKTAQAILIGHHGENTLTPNARNTVETLGDYLIGQGY